MRQVRLRPQLRCSLCDAAWVIVISAESRVVDNTIDLETGEHSYNGQDKMAWDYKGLPLSSKKASLQMQAETKKNEFPKYTTTVLQTNVYNES